ncbi:sensor domain-containing protein [Murinocardiopsis flavida]|nr:sensor domain-containing protein [Murinocardiopsis flavida]
MTNLLHRIGTDTRYLILGLPLALASFPLLVAGVAAGTGLMVVFVGFLVLSATLVMARGFASVERSMLPEITGRPVTRPRSGPVPAGAGWVRTFLHPLTHGQNWLDLMHGVVKLPLAIAGFVVAVTWWSGAIAGLAYPAYGWILRGIGDNGGLVELIGLGEGPLVDIGFHVAIGALFAATLPFVLRAAALLNAGLGQAMLAGSEDDAPHPGHLAYPGGHPGHPTDPGYGYGYRPAQTPPAQMAGHAW